MHNESTNSDVVNGLIIQSHRVLAWILGNLNVEISTKTAGYPDDRDRQHNSLWI
jgi:hypothetical protein